MGYIDDKEKMKADLNDHYHKIWFLIKITFIALAALLFLFCVVLVIGLISGDTGDTEPPVIDAPSSVVGYVGQTPTYKKFITVSDNDGQKPKVEVDNSKVKINKEGTYPVYYTVTDKAGNVSKHTLRYIVKSAEYSWDALEEQIEAIVESGKVAVKGSKKEQVREIYRYVNAKSTIDFTDESNIPNINRNNWESDWIEEAVLTLDSKEGDCYSYYSLSKAFFEYFEIENKGVKRAEGYAESNDDGTHFWNVVEIEEGWYYFDATSLKGTFKDGTSNACLITQKKLDGYRASDYKKHDVEDYFYKMTTADRNRFAQDLATKELK